MASAVSLVASLVSLAFIQSHAAPRSRVQFKSGEMAVEETSGIAAAPPMLGNTYYTTLYPNSRYSRTNGIHSANYFYQYSTTPTSKAARTSTYCPHQEMFSQIARINDHLYLSGLQALSPERLRSHGITQIVSVMVDAIPGALTSAVDSHIQVSVEDIDYSNLRVHFDSVADRIAREARRGGRTLVHCMAGVSRSATMVLAYLIKHQKMSLSEAYDHVKSKRPCIQPNLGFWRQLIAYEEARTGTRSMKIATDATSNLTLPASSYSWNYSSQNHRCRYH